MHAYNKSLDASDTNEIIYNLGVTKKEQSSAGHLGIPGNIIASPYSIKFL